MRQASRILGVDTPGRSLVDITRPVVDWATSHGIEEGLLTLFCRHTSASLLIQENADPAVRRDLLAWMEQVAPEAPGAYEHADEGPDDMPAHLRAAITPVQLSIPVANGRPVLATWQSVYLFEHRRRPHHREVALHLIGA